MTLHSEEAPSGAQPSRATCFEPSRVVRILAGQPGPRIGMYSNPSRLHWGMDPNGTQIVPNGPKGLTASIAMYCLC